MAGKHTRQTAGESAFDHYDPGDRDGEGHRAPPIRAPPRAGAGLTAPGGDRRW
ncbi:hypothetical protein EGH22_06900 [Halomicroarcula sp. F28]|uniref:hypothetical protein n=1 Tax=Haloarcula salinisoli TaxID=2487746 RepID=UPI001C73B88A|nr:hypothetical protein [Halomicroarcula salinisoli]MBX0286049.1 hypothetical protein [Halomicroarcula salinisoli]